jgi:hypothetical protein
MNGIRKASRQQNEEVLSKSTQGSNNANTQQRSDPKNNANITVSKLKGARVLPKGAVPTALSFVDHQYPPRQDETNGSSSTRRRQHEQEAAASEPYTATPIVTTATATLRRPQGGYEPARTTVRNPQIARGVGARTALFDDKDPSDAKLDSDRKGLVDGEEPDESKKFQK